MTLLITPQKAFEFGSKLEAAFAERFPKEGLKNDGTSGVNAVLLEYLGTEGYQQFCKKFKEKHAGKGSDAHFKEAYADNPQPTESIFYDGQIRFHHYGITSIVSVVKELLPAT